MRRIISAIYLFCLLSISKSLFAQVTFTAVNETVNCGNTSFCVDISVSNFDSVTSFQHVYEWDTSVMTLTAFNDNMAVLAPSSLGIAPNPDSLAVGRAPYSWLSFNASAGESFPPGTVITELCFDFNNIGSGGILFSESNTTLRRVDGFINGTLTGDIPAAYNNGSVSIQDMTAPSINCPSDVTVESFGTQVNGIAPTSFSDNCAIDSVSFVMMMGGSTVNSGLDDASGEAFSLGQTNVTYTVTDAGGNTDDCTFNVTLTPPPANSGSVQFIPEVNLDCDANTVSINILVMNFDSITGMQFGIEWNEMELDFTGSSNNLPAISSLNVSPAGNSVLSLFAPLNPADIPYSLPDNSVIFTLNFDLIGTLQSPAVDFIDFPGILIGVGQQQNGTDVNLVQDMDFFFMPEILNVIDNAAPTITNCPTNFSIDNNMGSCDAVATWTEPTIVDNCGLDMTTVSTMSGALLPVGDSTVTYTAIDLAGNMSTCSFVVTVNDIEPPVVTCPIDLTINTDAGVCTSSDAIGMATATDNCGVASLTNNAPTGFVVGMTTVTYTATDVNSLTGSCTQTVTVQDITPPTITCPTDITDCPNATITLGTPVTDDACGVVSVTNDAPGTFPLGVTTVTYTVEDSYGNTNTCTQTVTLADNENPMITCPADIVECPGTVITIVAPTTSDNCGVASVTNNAPGTFPLGTTIVTHTVEDVAGNTNTCTQSVNIDDVASPTIICPDNINVCPGTMIVIDVAITSDNCGVASVTNNAPGSFPLGTTIVTHTVVNDSGNSNTCEQTVTLEDTENPMITCPAAIAVCPGTMITIDAPTTSDNCGVASVTNDAPGTFPLGTTIVTHTVEDVAGNTNTCTQSVMVDDTANPSITCPADIDVCPGTMIIIDAPMTSDNCGIASVTNNAPGSFPLGTTIVTHTVVNDSGNSSTCEQTVSITDSEAPMITCPGTDAIEADPGVCTAVYVNSLLPTVTDNCDTNVSVTFAITGDSSGSGTDDATGSTFNVGTSTLTYTATDDAGNMNTCMATIQVNDEQNPSLTCPGDLVILAPGNIVDTMVNNIPAVVSDNCGIASLTFSYGGALMGNGIGDDASGTFFPPGVTTITYTAEDVNGNQVSCSFTVSVQETFVDLIDCPGDVVVNNDEDDCGAEIEGIAPILLIPTSSISSVTYTFSDATIGTGSDDASSESFNVGTTTIQYLVTDLGGNMDSCSFTVTVNDTQNPTWSNCPDNISTNITNTGDCSANVNWSIPLPVDNCAVDNISATASPGDIFPMGTTTVTYTATDVAGNMGTCSFDVSVIDNVAPIPQNCPDAIEVNSNLPDCQATVSWTEPTFDDCPPVSVTSTHAPGAVFNAGTTATVIYIAVDPAGNDTTCTFTVTVIDNVAPLPSCPSNVTVNSLSSDCGAFVNWPAPTATDNCDNNVAISTLPGQGTFFPVGTTTVTATATDDAGNSANCTFEVTVNDVFAPTFECPTEAIVVNVGGTIIDDDLGLINSTTVNANCDMLNIDYGTPMSEDNCMVQSVALNAGIPSGDAFPIGTSTVEFIAFDDSGNFVTCSFDIEVQGLVPISMTISPNDTVCAGESIQLMTDVLAVGATYQWSGPGGLVIPSVANPTISNVTEQNEGFYSVTVTYTGGCTSSATASLIVEEAAPVTASSNSPVCTGSDIELTTDVSTSGAMFSWTGPNNYASTDPSPIIMGGDPGIYSVTVTYPGGCSASSSTNVSTANLPAPEIDFDCMVDLCLGENCVLTGTDFAPSPEFYNWTASPAAGAGLPVNTNDNQITITPTQAGIYVYTYSVELNGCQSEEVTIAITVEGAPDAVEDTYAVDYETATTLSVLGNDAFNSNIGVDISVFMEPANGTLVFNEAEQNFTYTPNPNFFGTDQFFYEICNDCGPILCDNALVTLNVEFDGDCEVPTLITPNGDNVNDQLVISCIGSGNFPNNEILIYNQWGDEVFTAAPYQNNWRGTNDGADLPDGTYYVIFKLGNNADPIMQYVTIFR